MRGTRLIQIGFLVLLAVCVAQVGWWVIDQAIFADKARAEMHEHLLQDEKAAADLLDRGASAEEVIDLFNEIVILDDGTPRVNPSVLEHLDDVTDRRSRRYAWEGGFFLLVLLAGIVVLWRTLHQEASLRRRQQNFLAVVSHELKSPLAGVRLAAETIQLRDPEPERRERLIKRILGNLHRVESMVRNLLDAARLEEGRFHIERVSMDLAPVVDSVVQSAGDRLLSSGVEVEIDIPSDLRIQADPAAVETVLSNLLDNARKSVRRQGGGAVKIRAERQRRHVVLKMVDTGAGFPPQEAARLFAKFYRPGDELRRSGEGSGLGLYIVQRLIDLGGAKIEASSDGPGRGASFSIFWPPGEEKS